MHPLQKETGDLVTRDENEKAEVLHNVFPWLSTSDCSSHTNQVTEDKGEDCKNKEPPTGEDQFKNI